MTFLLYGLVLATWVSRLPGIKHHLGLDAGQLGLALVGSPVGLLLAMRAAPRLTERWGSATVARAAGIGTSACLPLLGAAWNLVSLLSALILFGAMLGVLDIAMNTRGVEVERAYGKPLMSGLHGLYSVGVLMGAICGSLAARAGVSPLAHFLLAGGAFALVAATTLRPADLDAPAVTEDDRAASSPGRAETHHRGNSLLLALGLIALCSFFVEGAVDDWSGIYLREVQHASFDVAPLGAAACGAGMTVGRLTGDRVIGRLGRVGTLWRAAMLAALGMGLAVLAPGEEWAIAGYAILGFGAATVVPIAFSLAGNAPGIAPATALSRVTTVGYVGLFGSPTVIGGAAQASSLDVALWIPVGLLLLVVPLSQLLAARGLDD